jgi:branched-subunit amino acid aminotransferase/4-amino-4-deoxychorismate lyase
MKSLLSDFERENTGDCRLRFRSGSAVDVIPVVKLDSRTIGDGRPGPLVKKLTERFHRLMRE